MLKVLYEQAVSVDFLSQKGKEGYITGAFKTGKVGQIFIETYKKLCSQKDNEGRFKESLKIGKVQEGYELNELFSMMKQVTHFYLTEGEIFEYLVASERAFLSYCVLFLSIYEIDLENECYLEMCLYASLTKMFSRMDIEEFAEELSAKFS